MMIKNIKISLLIIISTILLSSCGSVQKAFDPQNKNSSEEFLVKKKSPLSMPPSFEELPVPSNEKVDKEIQTNDIESLITEKNNNERLEDVETNKNFEQLILDKIKNN
jgi:PBP1b-binding outer membrane lipoprotein LpoB